MEAYPLGWHIFDTTPVLPHVNIFFFSWEKLMKNNLIQFWTFLTLVYLNNWHFLQCQSFLTFTINSQINLEMIVSSQLNDTVATGDQTNFLE